MKIYLDNNIIVSIEDGEIDFCAIKEKYIRDSFVYSITHLKELLEAGKNKDDLIKKRLHTISLITENLYAFPDTYFVNFKTEIPQKVMTDLNNQILITTLFRTTVKNFTADREKFIELFEIDLKRINNYTPKDVIEHIDEIMRRKLFLDFKSFLNQAGNSLSDNINFAYNFLDVIGFWKDKKSKKSNLARMYDASHTFYASACDIFVSNDGRARNKAKLIYLLYEIPTKVMSYDEFMSNQLK